MNLEKFLNSSHLWVIDYPEHIEVSFGQNSVYPAYYNSLSNVDMLYFLDCIIDSYLQDNSHDELSSQANNQQFYIYKFSAWIEQDCLIFRKSKNIECVIVHSLVEVDKKNNQIKIYPFQFKIR